MAADLGAVAERLFERVMAPLVLGGQLRPPHAIGARIALALGDAERLPVDIDLASRVQLGRVRRARRLVAVDRFGPATAAEWALAAGLSDVLMATNPAFDTPLRRGAARRILAAAVAGIECVAVPSNAKDALSRHTWLARLLEVTRTDTTVSWWVGSQTYRGVDPPTRITAWPSMRRVTVSARPTPIVGLAPLAFEPERLVEPIARLLERTPLTDLATCDRDLPPFAWTPGTLGLLASRAGRTLALRALARLSPLEADGALGRSTRELLKVLASNGGTPAAAVPQALAVAGLLAERTVAMAQQGELGSATSWPEDTAFARSIGAAAARRTIAEGHGAWSAEQRRSLLAVLDPVVLSAQGEHAAAMLGAAGLGPAFT